MNQEQNSNLIRSISCVVFVAVGVSAIVVAGLGMYQLRLVAASGGVDDYTDYKIFMFAVGLLDDQSQPTKPAELAARIQNLFIVCGLVGVCCLAVGLISLVIPKRRSRRAE